MMGRGAGERGPLFGGGMGGEFDTVGAGGGEQFTKIECGRCGSVMGVVSGRVYGPAYCGECWTRIQEDNAERDAAGGAGAGDAEEETGVAAGGGMDAGADAAEAEHGMDGSGNGGSGEGDGSGLALRLRSIMRSLADERGGEAPTRKEVLETMAVDGGNGAWRTADEAAHCLDNALCGIVYEPVEGRLALIDGE